MKVELVIKHARVVDATGEFDGGVAIQGGRIVMTGTSDALPEARRVIDAGGRVLMPGLIDPHCHLGVKYPYPEDMQTETKAAASGGITTVLLYARNTKESYLPFYDERRALGEANAVIDFGFHFGIQREEHIHEIPKIVAHTGVKSFKLYFGYEPDNPIGIVPATDGWVYAAMRQVKPISGGVVSVHCENTAIAAWIKKEIQATGRQDLGAYTESRPAFCEVETIRRMLFLAERTGCPLHLVHTSVGMGPVLAAEARARGIDVTVETCPHYLTRTAYDPDLDMKAKISPPLRDATEQAGLWEGVANGGVWSLGSDHVPFLPKKGEDLWAELPGVVSFPWELALLLHFGVHQRGLPLPRLVELTSAHAAQRFGLWPKKGSLRAGADADLVLVDLDETREVEHTGKGTCIYTGWKLKGWPVMTISRGEVVYEDGEVTGAAGRARCVTVPA
ncbi:dihydropyrimidinase [Pandoraea terrae]|uniref:Dihydropyrimidinase n=1 Tax=Pandoraea terrae TaxID=1537710 RepID=A0A5E4ZG88_9BURK|nr:amidohydrolase family protein [Pandoraea terrae]VVE59657.1 dihydropyrimidinase [Pandoraea terrae]